MRNILFAVFCLLGGCFTLTGCDVATMSTLQELSRPYVGEYRCEQLTVGGRDFLGKKDLRLALEQDGTFELFFAGKNRSEISGNYEVSEGGEQISFTAGNHSRSFPIYDGAICIELPLGSRLLYAQFKFL